jgi:hypothetical protein
MLLRVFFLKKIDPFCLPTCHKYLFTTLFFAIL